MVRAELPCPQAEFKRWVANRTAFGRKWPGGSPGFLGTRIAIVAAFGPAAAKSRSWTVSCCPFTNASRRRLFAARLLVACAHPHYHADRCREGGRRSA